MMEPTLLSPCSKRDMKNIASKFGDDFQIYSIQKVHSNKLWKRYDER